MSKMSELSQALDEMIACGEGMIRAASALQEIFSGSEETAAEQPAVKEPAPIKEEKTEAPAVEQVTAKTYSFADVRKAFSAKSHAGFTEQVKGLITKYGADKLSGIKPEDYAAIMADLEVIG